MNPKKHRIHLTCPLAGIVIIGEAYAKQLKENEIESYCDLILKADTPSARDWLTTSASTLHSCCGGRFWLT
jgi:hypothetical protein